MDFAVKYQTARDRILIELQPLLWTSWKMLRRIGGVRYSARLLELKRLGYKIEDRSDPSGDGKQYRLIDPIPGKPQGKLVKIYLPEHDADELTQGMVTSKAQQIVRTALRIFRANRHKL